MRTLALLVVACSILAGCGGGVQVSARPAGPASIWGAVALDSITALKTSPPVSARGLAVVHTAIFDAWAAYDATAVGTRLGDSLRRPQAERTNANKNKAIAYAAYRTLLDIWPARKAAYDAKMSELGYDPSDSTQDSTTPAGIGNLAAAAVLDYRHQDGSNQLGDLGGGPYQDYTGYAPVNTVDNLIDPNRWQPQRFVDSQGSVTVPKFVTPHWGRVTPFAATAGSALRPPAPVPAGTPAFIDQCQELIDIQVNLTDEQKVIAEYWADGPNSVTPPGHWCLFAQEVSRSRGFSLDDDVKLMFIVANAVMDASICCWEAKRFYDYVRPISAIRWAFGGKTIRAWAGKGKGVKDIDGATWKPYQPDSFITPPFAEYTSGHSTFSASSAEVLKRFTGSDALALSVTIPAGASAVEPGISPSTSVTLSWQTFSDAADEAGMSRRYGGIHFKDGDLRARQMGRTIGAMVYSKAMTFINGTAIAPKP